MLSISVVHDEEGDIQNYVAMLSDITLLKVQQQKLEQIAHYDILTHLPNRMLLAEHLQEAVFLANTDERFMVVAYIDLDGFKEMNDRYGHEAGDLLLVTVSRRMKAALREKDVLARMGGDEFVALIVSLDNPQACQPILGRLLQAAADPVVLGNLSMQVSASIGVAICPPDGSEPDQLIRHADQAMYRAKQLGKSRFYFWQPSVT